MCVHGDDGAECSHWSLCMKRHSGDGCTFFLPFVVLLVVLGLCDIEVEGESDGNRVVLLFSCR